MINDESKEENEFPSYKQLTKILNKQEDLLTKEMMKHKEFSKTLDTLKKPHKELLDSHEIIGTSYIENKNHVELKDKVEKLQSSLLAKEIISSNFNEQLIIEK